MNLSDAIQTLEFFNEKADKLNSSRFAQRLLGGEVGVTIRWDQDTRAIETERNSPDDDSVDAFVLTFRFFIQNNERISFQRMATLYSGLSIDSRQIDRFNEIRSLLNQYLDNTTDLGIQIDGQIVTRRHLMDTFVYGGLAHGKAEKKDEFDAWRELDPSFSLLQFEFVTIMGKMLATIQHMRAINDETISMLSI